MLSQWMDWTRNRDWQLERAAFFSMRRWNSSREGAWRKSYEGDLDWSQRQDALVIRSPREDAGKYAFVFEVTLD